MNSGSIARLIKSITQHKINIILVFIFVTFFVIYCLISFVNHYLFRTNALDLGMFNHAIYSFSHLKMNYFTLNFWGPELSYFGDHFSPIVFLFSPFYYLFGSYTLLVIQIVFVLFGGYGIYKYACLQITESNTKFLYIPLLILVQFLGIWGIFSALSFDFHTNVVAAMMVPWLVYYYEKNNKAAFLLFFVLILISKENMSLWLAFIILGLTLKKGNFNRKFLRFEYPLVIFAMLYFILIIGIVMPAINHGEGTNQLSRYSFLGESISDIVIKIISEPKQMFILLFESPKTDPVFFGIKAEFHFMVLVSGGFALFYRPYYLVMLIPLYAQKFLTTDTGMWGINAQYSIEFAPIISLCIIDVLSGLKRPLHKYSLILLTTISTLYFTYTSIERQHTVWYSKTNAAFYSKEHYQSPLNIPEIYKALAVIPKGAVISVSSPLAPHIADRDSVYHYPKIRTAEFIVLAKWNSYPIQDTDYMAQIMDYRSSLVYRLYYENADVIIFKRIAKAPKIS